MDLSHIDTPVYISILFFFLFFSFFLCGGGGGNFNAGSSHLSSVQNRG